MTPFDRQVRAQIYRHLAAGAPGPTADELAETRGWPAEEVAEAMHRLEQEHQIALVPGETRVWMAHPFSGVPTGYEAVIGERTWFANCAWDSLAILALLGDGRAVRRSQSGEDVVWEVEDGKVSPDGLIHLLVPAREFWTDIGFT
jgi:hypothetical protein